MALAAPSWIRTENFFISEDVRVDPYSQVEGIRKLTCLAGLAVANQDTDVLFLITNI